MRDTRLDQAAALIVDARTLLVDVVDDRPVDASLRDFNHIDVSRQFLNAALTHVQLAQTPVVLPLPDGVA